MRLTFETAGVVVALTFVAAPFYMRQAQAAFGRSTAAGSRPRARSARRRARTFARVAIPTAAPGLLTGGALAWAARSASSAPR